MKDLIAKYILPGAAILMLVFGVYHTVNSERVFAIPMTTPPLAVPSSLVRASAVTSVALVNCLACSMAF